MAVGEIKLPFAMEKYFNTKRKDVLELPMK